eukprot:scaffold5253_cov128-Isochrysis_galbana.AAC.1
MPTDRRSAPRTSGSPCAPPGGARPVPTPRRWSASPPAAPGRPSSAGPPRRWAASARRSDRAAASASSPSCGPVNRSSRSRCARAPGHRCGTPG